MGESGCDCGVASRGEARRLISGGAVRLDGETVEELDLPREAVIGKVLQRGRRDFVRLREAIHGPGPNAQDVDLRAHGKARKRARIQCHAIPFA